MGNSIKKSDFNERIAELVREALDELIDQAPQRILSAEHDQASSPFLGTDYIEDVTVIDDGVSEIDADFFEPRIEDQAYCDDGRLVYVMSDGTIRFIDPYTEDIEYLGLWDEVDDE